VSCRESARFHRRRRVRPDYIHVPTSHVVDPEEAIPQKLAILGQLVLRKPPALCQNLKGSVVNEEVYCIRGLGVHKAGLYVRELSI
jgi:hypothetical protein